jgi:hypothetical protein
VKFAEGRAALANASMFEHAFFKIFGPAYINVVVILLVPLKFETIATYGALLFVNQV